MGGKLLPPSPVALWCAKETGIQPSNHPFKCSESFFGNLNAVQDQAVAPVGDWGSDLTGQTYDGGVLVNHRILEPTSSRSSQQQFSTHANPDDSHSQSMPDVAVNTRARSPHGTAGCSLGLRSCSLPSDSEANNSSTPRQKCMQRGFLLPAARSCSEDDGSPSAVYAPTEAQVFLLPQNQHRLLLSLPCMTAFIICIDGIANHAGQGEVYTGDLHCSA